MLLLKFATEVDALFNKTARHFFLTSSLEGWSVFISVHIVKAAADHY